MRLFQSLFILFCALIPGLSHLYAQSTYEYPFRNPGLPLDARVADLIGRLSLEEKVSLMPHAAAGIPRLGIPEYNWWSEALHGVARSSPATVFPQAIGLAATFDPVLIEQVGDAISEEGRAIYHAAIRKGIHKHYMGLTFWSPNVNIFRDPRWGRGHETYGEDPFLAGEIGAAFVRGIQGDNPDYLKAAACAKHFAVHSGPEAKRHVFNAIASPKDLNETYLPAFKRLVDEGVAGVMCAYNRTNDEGCCMSPTLLLNTLRRQWGFKGYIVSDCWALSDLHNFHKITANAEESAAAAVKSDVNVNCGVVYNQLDEAVRKGLATEAEVDGALDEQLRIRFRLGMFDPPEQVIYAGIGEDAIHPPRHVELAREAARKSAVLLKNRNNALPLRPDIGQLYVTGHNAADVNVLIGNYFGISSSMVTILEGIAGAVSPTTVLQYSQGLLVGQKEVTIPGMNYNASVADATIAVIGLSPLEEGEEGDAIASDSGGDRLRIELPAPQVEFVKDLKKRCGDKPLIVVICGGSAMAFPEIHDVADAILWVGYPGEQGGNGLADLIFGRAAPSGRLPVTFYAATEQLGDFEDYRIAEGGKTYKYFRGSPLYPFAFGLGYSDIRYSPTGSNRLSMLEGVPLSLKVKVANQGSRLQEEVVQLYTHKNEAPFPAPQYALRAFQRVSLEPGETKVVEFLIDRPMLEEVDMDGRRVLLPGAYTFWVGGASPHLRAQELGASKPVQYNVTLRVTQKSTEINE